MLWLRKIVFYIFALIYLILCPLIVARMLGFVINPLTHRFEKTGLVYVSTNPPDATIYIDGRMAHQKTPAVVRDLTPGKHFIRIEENGYNDWERTFPIVKKKATVLANVLLIPDEWPIKVISNEPYQNIFSAADGILIASNPTLKNIDLFHTTHGIEENFKEDNTYQKTPLFTLNSIYADAQLIHLYSASQSPFILLEAMIKDKHKFLWVNLNENPPLIEDISDLFPETPTRIAWDNTNYENIFAFYPTNIYRVNVKDKAIYPLSLKDLPPNLDESNQPQDRFLINDKNDLLIREKNLIRIYPKENFGAPQIFDITKSRLQTNMYFEEETGELFYLNDSLKLCTAQILPFHPILNIPIPERLQFNNSNNNDSYGQQGMLDKRL